MTIENINLCSPHSPLFGFLGVAAAMVLSNLGAAYGMAKSSIGIFSMGVTRPDLALKAITPCIMASILAIYGFIVGFMIQSGLGDVASYSQAKAYSHLAAGLTVGISCLAAGLAIGIVGDSGVRAFAHQQKLFTIMILILIFAEALALFGLILAMVVSTLHIENACIPIRT